MLLCTIVVMLVSWFLFRGSKEIITNQIKVFWTMSIPLYVLQFLTLFYFILSIKTIKKAVLCSIFIPYYCCLFFLFFIYISGIPIPRDEYLPSLELRHTINAILYDYYILTGSWIVSLFLLLACGLHLYVSRRTKQYSGKQETVSILSFQQVVVEMKLFQHTKLALNTVAIFLISIVIHALIYRLFWLDSWNRNWIPVNIYVNLYSLLSLFILAHVIIGQKRQTFIFCLTVPIFWCLVISVIFAVTLLLFAWDQHDNDIFSMHFYLDFYLKSQSWFISLPLLLICYIYTRLAKSELAHRAKNQKESEELP